MSTDLKKPVHEGRAYEIRFSNHVTSSGNALILVGWVPNHHHPVPSVQEAVCAPAATESVTGTVPSSSAAHRMSVVVSLDEGESGELELLENGKTHSKAMIDETTNWEMVVV